MESNDDIVRRFCGAFERMDADELIEFFTEEPLITIFHRHYCVGETKYTIV